MTLDTDQLIGTWRRFGSSGPVYEVISAGSADRREFVRVRVLETGEEIDYSVAELLDDPRER